MHIWIFLVVFAQILGAIVALIDKYFVTGERAPIRPFVYAFYTTFLSGTWIAVYLFGLLSISFFGFNLPSFANVEKPTIIIAGLSLVSAYALFYALTSLFKALRHADASDVVPVVGAVSAFVSFLLDIAFFDAKMTPNFIFGIALLGVGTLFVSHFRFTWQTALTAVHSGLFFAVHFVILKEIFNETTFDNGFFWSRLALVMVALSTLLVPRYFVKIFSQTKKSTARTNTFLLFNKFLAGISAVLVIKATQLGSVSVVQALAGLQFVFILLIGLIFRKHIVAVCEECIKSDRDVFQKIFAVAVITIGFFVLFIPWN